MVIDKKLLRVLYIEDDPHQRKELSHFLRAKKFRVTVAASGKVGLKYFVSRSFDAILCDLNMPNINGLKVLEKVRSVNESIPFILLTAHGTISLAVKAIKQGADHFIHKPAPHDEITVTLKQLIDRSRLMRRLQDSERTLKLVSDNLPDVIYSLNAKGEFTSLSKGVEQSLKYKPSELLGTSVFDVIHPDDRKRVLNGYTDSIKSGDGKTRTLQFRMISRNGESRYYEISRKLVFENGKAVRSDGIARDITERIKLENQLREYSQQLEKKVEERTKRLSRANRQLAELNKISNRFSEIYDQQKIYDLAPKMLIKSLDFSRAYLAIKLENNLEIISYCCHQNMTAGLIKYIEDVKKGKIKLPPHFKRCFKNKKTAFIPDLKAEKSWPKKPTYLARAKSMVIAPLVIENEAVGLIVGFKDDESESLDNQDVQRFEMYAKIVSFALSNIRAYQSLERKVEERTKSLRDANEQLRKKTDEIDYSRIELAKANVELLSVQEQLEAKNDEMKKILDELSRKHRELQIVVDSAPEVILLVNNENVVQLVNKAVREFFGLDKTEVVGIDFNLFIERISKNFSDEAKFLKIIETLIGRPDNLETFDITELQKRSLKCIGDNPQLFAPTVIAIKDEKGAEVGRLWDFVNITKFIEAEQRVKAIVNTSPIPTIISKIDSGKVLYANEHLAKLVGMNRSDVVGHSTTEFYFDTNDRDKVIEGLKRNGYVRNIEIRLKRIDGTPVWTIFSLVVTEISGEKVILGGIYDISQQKEVEAALISERNFVTAILDTTSSLVVVLDREGRVVRFNRACEEITGYKSYEIKDLVFWKTLIIPDEIDLVKARFNSMINGEFPIQGENYWLTRTGEKRLISWSNTALLDSEGEVTYIVATGIDITEQRQAQQDLKRAYENLAQANDNLTLYKEIFMNTNDGIMIMNNEAIVLERNPVQGEHSGVSDDELIGKKPSFMIGDKKFEDIFASAVKTGSYRGELDFKRRDGVRKIVDLMVFPLKNERGEINYYVGMGRDISERKAAERAIAQRLKYEEGLANCSQALLTGDDPGRAIDQALSYLMKATDVSRVYIFENFEHEEKGLCARMIHEVTLEEEEPRLENPLLQRLPYGIALPFWQKFLEMGDPVGFTIDDIPDKSRELLESFGVYSMAAIPITVDGKWYGFLGFDDTRVKREWGDDDLRTLQTAGEMIGIHIERRRFEEALSVSEERFRTLVENANDIIYSTDEHNVITYVSPTVKEVLGYEPEEMIGISAESLLHETDRETSEIFYKTGEFKQRERWSGYRFRMMHKNGGYKWFVSNASVLFNDDGQVREIIGVAHDITEIQKLLEALEKANEEIKSAQLQLIQSEKMASLGMLVAGIAHEINTPIGATSSMHNTAVRAQEKLQKYLKEKFKDDIDKDEILQKIFRIIDEANKIIESGAGRVTNIVRRLKSFARLDEAELQTVNIRDGLEDTLTLIHHEIKHDISVIKEFSELPEIACFPGQLNQVFLNLLVNASQAITGKGTITIRTYLKNDRVYVELSDTGSGIKPENMSKIFDPGFTTKGVGVGTGLGLSICFKIIQTHRGKITASSKIGQGTTFKIELPTNLEKLLEKRNNDD